MKKSIALLSTIIIFISKIFSQSPCNLSSMPLNLQNGLISYYPFCSNANDAGINNNDGTIVMPVNYINDRFGNFSSAINCRIQQTAVGGVKIPTTNFPFGNSPRTISAWFKLDTIFSSFYGNRLFAYGMEINNSGQGIRIFIDSTAINAVFGLGSTNVIVSANWNADLNWHNLSLIVPNGADSTSDIIFVLDSIQLSSTSLNTALLNTMQGASGTATIGGDDNVMDQGAFLGSADDVLIYNRALSMSEILQLYNWSTPNCTTYYSVTDTLIINANLTNINPLIFQNTIKIFPNPSNDHITIDNGSNFQTLAGYTLRIDNSLASVVYSTLITQQNYTVDLNTWTGNGVYFVYLIDGSGNTIDIRKIVVQ